MAKKIIIFAGTISMMQALIQIIFGSLSIAQYFCVVDFLRNNRELLLIKILYFTHVESCGNTIRIGNVFDGIANQALIILNREAYLSTRTLILSVAYTTLGYIWALAASMLIGGGGRMNSYSRSYRWTWVTATICVCVVDIVACMLYANDSFHTQTLQDIAQHIGATVSGIRGVTVNTSATSWIMFAVSARLLVVLIMNIVLTIVVALQSYNQRQRFHENDAANEPQPVQRESRVNSGTYTKTTGAQIADAVRAQCALDESVLPERPWQDMPRAYLSQAFRNMKKQIIKRTSRDSTRHPVAVRHGQLPWAYVPAASARPRQREVGSSDEDTPPMPLQGFTAFETPKGKAFVHRASSTPSIQHTSEMVQYKFGEDLMNIFGHGEQNSSMDKSKLLAISVIAW